MSFWIVVGILVVIGLWAIAVYNGLVSGRNQAQTAWSQIDVQLKRRHDLIPNLVQVVKDAMGYEQETLTKVVQARNAAVAASGNPAQAGPAEDAAAAVASILDRFNAGDVDAFFRAHQDGATIVDEFAPFFWTGSGSAQRLHWPSWDCFYFW